MNSGTDDTGESKVELEPKPQTEVCRGGGGMALTRNGSGNDGDGREPRHPFRQFGDFDPRSEIPKGIDFVRHLESLFTDLTPSVMKALNRMANFELLSMEDEQHCLNRLRKNAEAGDAIYRLSSRNRKLIAWVTKDFALDLASNYNGEDQNDLNSLVFTEMYVRGTQAFGEKVLRGACADASQFTAIICDAMADIYARFDSLGASGKLYKVLKFRSVENELMQKREERISDEELSSALNVSIEELNQIKEWNSEDLHCAS